MHELLFEQVGHELYENRIDHMKDAPVDCKTRVMANGQVDICTFQAEVIKLCTNKQLDCTIVVAKRRLPYPQPETTCRTKGGL